MTEIKHRSRRLHGDRGVTIILVALALIAIMIVVALVIDLSNARTSRQDSKLVADAATAAGLQKLAGDGVAWPWRGACNALDYLQANDTEHNFTITYKNGLGTPLGGSPPPCNVPAFQNVPCLMTGTEIARKATWAWIEAADGDYVVDIKTGYHTPDADFPEDTGAHLLDNGVAANNDCDQLAVIVGRTDPAFFGGIVGTSDYSTTLRTVGRVDLGFTSKAVPAFLILERTGCDVLTNSVGGSGNIGIHVLSPDGVDPGLVHVDSNATTNCGNDQSQSRAVIATTLSSGGSSLTVDGAGTATGVIAINALAPGGNAAKAYRDYPGGMNVEPTEGGIISRAPADAKYNSAPATISTIHGDARELVNATTAPSLTTTISSCNPTAAQQLTPGALYISCATFDASGNVTFPLATSITFSGDVTPSNGEQISLPLATSIVIRGQLAYGGSSGLFSAPAVRDFYVKSGVSMAGGGHELRVNSTSSTTCVGGASPATRFVVFGGDVEFGGPVTLCSTFLFLAGPSTSIYVKHQTISGGSCTALLPCPSTGMTGPNLSVAGNTARVVWEAPNQTSGLPAVGSQGIEDLAFWTESSSTSSVTSNGTIAATGVFFLPNAHVNFSSPSVATPRNSQFIARSLNLFQGTLRMQPTANDSISIPVDASPGLVR